MSRLLESPYHEEDGIYVRANRLKSVLLMFLDQEDFVLAALYWLAEKHRYTTLDLPVLRSLLTSKKSSDNVKALVEITIPQLNSAQVYPYELLRPGTNDESELLRPVNSGAESELSQELLRPATIDVKQRQD